jgi:dihydroxyacid dehydratase/phosphogluconate dehydratase
MSGATKADRGLPSRHVTEGLNTALNRIYFHAMGLSREDIERPIVGVVAAWDGSSASGKAPLRSAGLAQGGIWAAGGMPRQFATISDDAGEADPTLIGRELIADSVELTVRGHCYDALVGVTASAGGMAGLAMAMCRLDVPARLAPLLGEALESDPDAVAMAAALRELGLALPEVRPAPKGVEEIVGSSHAAGAPVLADLEAGSTPRSRIDAAALGRAAAAAGAAGGAADLVVHLLAIANECGVDADPEELVAAFDAAAAGRSVWCNGELAPEGALLVCDADAAALRAEARVFDDPESALAFAQGGWPSGTAIVVRGQGPAGAPGLRRLEALRRGLAELDLPNGVALISDGRIGPLPGVICVGCVSPEAAVGGPLAALRDGDPIVVDPAAARLDGEPSGNPEARVDPHAGAPRLQKYAVLVGPARTGAVTHPGARRERHRYADL